MSKKIAIIGGGLAGLSAAIHGVKNGFEVEIFEKESQLGGRVAHSEIDGFYIDHGFQVINPGYSEIKRINALDGVGSAPIFSRINFIDNEGALKFISPKNLGSLLSHASGSLFQKFDFLTFLIFRTSPLVTWGDQRVRFKRLNDVLLAPFLAGVFLTDPAKVRSTLAQKITRSFLRGKPQLIDGGVGNFVIKLSERIPSENIDFNATVVEISKESTGRFTLVVKEGRKKKVFDDHFDYVIDASGSRPQEILGTSGGNTREWLSSTTVFHSCQQIHENKNALFVGKKEVHDFVNTVAVSEANHTLAPAGEILIATTYLGKITQGHLSAGNGRLIAQIADIYGVDRKELSLVSIQYIPHSLPSFERVDSNDPLFGELEVEDSQTSGIFYAGDYMEAPSQNGAMASGRKVIEIIKKRS